MRKKKEKVHRWMACALSAAMVCTGMTVYTGAQETENDRIGQIIAGMTMQEKVGQMIMADFRTWNENPEDEESEAVPVTELRKEIRDAISRDRFGGIILFAENCAGNEQTLRLVNEMQKANQETQSDYAVPLLIAADQEGGGVARLGEGTRWIGNMALTATGDPANAGTAAGCIGEELSLLSINTDFAPVLDVNNNPANPVIGPRSFSDDPAVVAEYGVRYLQGLMDTGTIVSLKHFPGHGDVAVDSHTGFPVLEKTYEELKECELIPFQAAIDAGADMVMTAHIQYPKIETRTYTSTGTGEEVCLPATLSPTILTDILRKDMGFEGVIVSDSLVMAAIADNFDRNDVAAMAIEAGVDLLLMPVPVTDRKTLEELEAFIQLICKQVESGEIAESRIDESVRRILTMKEKHGLLDPVNTDLPEKRIKEAADQVGNDAFHSKEWKMMQKAVTLLKNDDGLIPVTAAEGEKILFLYTSESRLASAEFARRWLAEEGLLPENVTFEAMTCSAETEADCLKAAGEADLVIGISTLFSQGELDPSSEDGAASAVLDKVIDTVHDNGRRFILVSAYLPYDTARYSAADAILAAYGSYPMRALPEGKECYSVNIPAAICGIFGEFECTGILPVDIPALDENYMFTDENLYSRGDTGSELQAAAEPWQLKAVFPDWKGYPDDTLAMNSMISFYGCHGQGTVYIQPKEEVTSFRMYVNGTAMDTADMTGGETIPVDISSLTKNGENTIQISNILPSDLTEAVTVCVPYPEILPGTPEEEGISAQALEMISDLIETDIENGFTSAQLAVVRNGRLVYENAWGKTNSYLPDGSVNAESPEVTTETLYDLASVTKMFSVNYALQKLVTDGALDLDTRIADILGERFVDDTVLIEKDEEPDDETEKPDLATIKAWKSELTVRDLLRHQGGFPGDPKYASPLLYKEDLEEGETYPENPLFAGNGADEETRKATVDMIFKTPLEYEPGTNTVYSDADYMILGLVAEKITGKDLNTWLKETFWEPLGLTHITYNPLQHGFLPDDCAATELNGNTRDHLLDFPGFRTYTLQGEVHDEKAWYSMMGVSGHAGLFANASDLAKLASVMLSGGYGEHRFFSRNVMDQFTAPKRESTGNWGLGWWRQGDNQRVWYFGTQAASGTFGHQGWTGTLVMIDPARQLVIVYLTNKINSPVTDAEKDANRFDGNWYTASTLGFVPQILSMGMDMDMDISAQLLDLSADMAVESLKLIPEDVVMTETHPSVRNAESKKELFEKMAEKSSDEEQARTLKEAVETAFDRAAAEHEASSAPSSVSEGE